MVREEIIGSYLQTLSSDAPVPGGGSAAGLFGAAGVSLMLMAIRLTYGKKAYAKYEDLLRGIESRGEALKETFLTLSDRDEEAYLALSGAYRMPKETEEEASCRDAALRKALSIATEVPMETMRSAVEALGLLRKVALHSAKSVVSDAGVASTSLRSALVGASMNVLINLRSMTDEGEAEAIRVESDRLLQDGIETSEAILGIVRERIQK